eukprot:SAG31_NODE_2509_length_5588_cov_2.936170_2_plen_584_part_00
MIPIEQCNSILAAHPDTLLAMWPSIVPRSCTLGGTTRLHTQVVAVQLRMAEASIHLEDLPFIVSRTEFDATVNVEHREEPLQDSLRIYNPHETEALRWWWPHCEHSVEEVPAVSASFSGQREIEALAGVVVAPMAMDAGGIISMPPMLINEAGSHSCTSSSSHQAECGSASYTFSCLHPVFVRFSFEVLSHGMARNMWYQVDDNQPVPIIGPEVVHDIAAFDNDAVSHSYETWTWVHPITSFPVISPAQVGPSTQHTLILRGSGSKVRVRTIRFLSGFPQCSFISRGGKSGTGHGCADCAVRLRHDMCSGTVAPRQEGWVPLHIVVNSAIAGRFMSSETLSVNGDQSTPLSAHHLDLRFLIEILPGPFDASQSSLEVQSQQIKVAEEFSTVIVCRDAFGNVITLDTAAALEFTVTLHSTSSEIPEPQLLGCYSDTSSSHTLSKFTPVQIKADADALACHAACAGSLYSAVDSDRVCLCGTSMEGLVLAANDELCDRAVPSRLRTDQSHCARLGMNEQSCVELCGEYLQKVSLCTRLVSNGAHLQIGMEQVVENIAISKSTTQSSEAHGGVASRAVDGNRCDEP